MSVLQGAVYSASYAIPGGVIAGSTVTLTVTAPDGTTSTPAVTQGATSTAKVPATQVGMYLLVWSSTGAVVDALSDQFASVAPALFLLSLSDVKDQLNIQPSDTTERAKLLRFLASATSVVEHVCGPLLPVPYTSVLDGGSTMVVLPWRWIKSITSVTESVGAATYTLTEQPLGGGVYGAYGYTWDRETNALTRRVAGTETQFMPGQKNVTVVYTLGMTSIPQDVQDATGELIRHWWEHGQSAYTAPYGPNDDGEADMVQEVMGYAVPKRVAEMLEPFALGPTVA